MIADSKTFIIPTPVTPRYRSERFQSGYDYNGDYYETWTTVGRYPTQAAAQARVQSDTRRGSSFRIERI